MTTRKRDLLERIICVAVTPLCVGVVIGLWLARQIEDILKRDRP